MSFPFCRFEVLGNLTRDPVTTKTKGGTAVTRYTVASTDYRKDASGNSVEEVSFIPVTTFGRQAENDAKYLAKGSSVFVKGPIVSWSNAEQHKFGHYFKGEDVKYLGKPSGSKATGDDAEAGALAPADNFVDEGWLDAYQQEEDRLTTESSRHNNRTGR